MTSKDCYASAAAHVAEAEKIRDLAASENRDLTEEELGKINEHLALAEAETERGDTLKRLEMAAFTLDEDEPVASNPISIPAMPRDRQEEGKGGFKSFGDFASTVMRSMSPGGQRDGRLVFEAAATGMSQGTPSDGGFLVPPTFSKAIWDGLYGSPDSLLARCDQYTVEGESLTFNANAETSRATGSRYGGVRGYWIAEAAQITASKPTVRQVKVEPQELAVLIYVTNKLLKNASALESYLTRAASDEISFMVGDSIINGTGVGQPLGILNSACLVTVAKQTSQAADTIVAANLRKMRARLHPRSWSNAVWLINIDCRPELENLFTQVTNVAGSENVGGFDPRLFDPAANTLLGKPIIDCEYCATVGDAGDIILADLGAYIAGVKGAVESAMSIHLRFDYAETAFRFMYAVDGKPWLLSALTPYKGTNTLSTFVNLAARA